MILIRPLSIADTGSFTRSTTATYFNSSGLVAIAPINDPRLNFDPNDLDAPPTLLLEAAATNLLLRSEDFANAAWTVSLTAGDITVMGNTATAPDGTLTGDRIDDLETTTDAYLSQAITVANDALTRTFSVFLKEGTTAVTQIDMLLTGGTPVTVSAVVDWAAHTTTLGILDPAGPAGWYRLQFPIANNTSGNTSLAVRIRPAGNSAADIGYVFAWGAQIEVGAVATSYIPTTAAAVVRAADVGMPAMATNVLEDEVVYNGATTYPKDAIVRGTGVYSHTVFASMQDTNVGHALTDTTWWLPYSSTNRWRLFDQVVGSQTSNFEKMAVVIPTTGRIDSVVLLNIRGASARVIMEDAIDGVVFDQTFSLISSDGISDWYSYFFEPVDLISDLWVKNLPPYANTKITVIIEDPGSTVFCGACIPGFSTSIGGTEYGARLGIQDYSVKDRDVFGNITVLERAYTRRGSFTTHIEASKVDQSIKLLASLRATPIVYIGSEFYTSSMIYGFYKDFDLVVAYKRYSVYSLELESLT